MKLIWPGLGNFDLERAVRHANGTGTCSHRPYEGFSRVKNLDVSCLAWRVAGGEGALRRAGVLGEPGLQRSEGPSQAGLLHGDPNS